VEALEFDGNLNLESYLHWVQAIERIFKLKDYDHKKAFKLAILKLMGYASLWYEHLKKGRGREAKSKIKIWSKLKKHMDKRFYPLLTSKNSPQDHLPQPRESKGIRIH